MTDLEIDLVDIMRHPVLMEDEGRHFLIKSKVERKEAEEWIAKQKGEYFSPGDYYIRDNKKE